MQWHIGTVQKVIFPRIPIHLNLVRHIEKISIIHFQQMEPRQKYRRSSLIIFCAFPPYILQRCVVIGLQYITLDVCFSLMKPKKRNSNNDPRTTLKKKNPVFDNMTNDLLKCKESRLWRIRGTWWKPACCRAARRTSRWDIKGPESRSLWEVRHFLMNSIKKCRHW